MTDPFNPAVPAGAYDEFLLAALARARAQRPWAPGDAAPPGCARCAPKAYS
jgi:4,5-DOPA dioxygenase extradiol